jgi:hypothetical protein
MFSRLDIPPEFWIWTFPQPYALRRMPGMVSNQNKDGEELAVFLAVLAASERT